MLQACSLTHPARTATLYSRLFLRAACVSFPTFSESRAFLRSEGAATGSALLVAKASALAITPVVRVMPTGAAPHTKVTRCTGERAGTATARHASWATIAESSKMVTAPRPGSPPHHHVLPPCSGPPACGGHHLSNGRLTGAPRGAPARPGRGRRAPGKGAGKSACRRAPYP